MIYIRKGNEPRSLTEHRSKPEATYDNYQEKDDVRKQLLEEQGYICAYCMRRISIDKMKIEHWIAQNSKDGTGLDHALEYRNMLGVCLGNQSHPHDAQTCDTYRGNEKLFVDPRCEAHIQRIEYRGDGTIYSRDQRIDDDLNQRLNLNGAETELKAGRKEAIQQLQSFLQRKHPQGTWNVGLLKKVKSQFAEKQDGKFKPYVGVVLYQIDRYLKKTT